MPRLIHLIIVIKERFTDFAKCPAVRVLDLPKSAPVAALYLELGVLAIQFEIETTQSMFLEENESDFLKIVSTGGKVPI